MSQATVHGMLIRRTGGNSKRKRNANSDPASVEQGGKRANLVGAAPHSELGDRSTSNVDGEGAVLDGGSRRDGAEPWNGVPGCMKKDVNLGPGPHIFYCYVEQLLQLFPSPGCFSGFPECAHFVLKQTALEAYRKVVEYLPPPNDPWNAIGEHLDGVKYWMVEEVELQNDAEVDALLQGYYSSRDESAAQGGDPERESWYEVTVQEQRLENGSPQLALQVEGSGVWWATALREADTEGHRAMIPIGEHLANY